MIRLDLLNIGLVEETGGILLVMRAPAVSRLLVIETGLLEGQAVAMEAEGIRADRPLTHDLIYNVMLALGGRIQEVRIQDFHDETFFAKIVMSRPNGGPAVEVDARPSDAIALALRAQAPIFVSDQVMSEAGVPEDRQGRFAELYGEEEEDDDLPTSGIIH